MLWSYVYGQALARKLMKVTSSAFPRKRVRAWRPDQQPRPARLRLVPLPRGADVGIRLAMEAADRTAQNYTWRERCALMVFAMSAMDDTRECPPGIEDRPEIVRRLGLSRTQRYAVIATLVEKGMLEHLERGRNGVKARYAITPAGSIPGAGRPGDPDARPVDNTLKGPSNRDASATAKGPGSENEGSLKPGLKRPSNRDPAPYIGTKGFKTGGGTPLPPSRPTFPLALPDAPPEEGASLMAKNPAPSGTRGDRMALAAEIVKTRPEWSARSVIRALERPSVAERPWPIVAESMRLMAADPKTQHAGRLEHDGPWWPEAARRVAQATPPPVEGAHPFIPNENGDCCRCPLPEDSRFHQKREAG